MYNRKSSAGQTTSVLQSPQKKLPSAAAPRVHVDDMRQINAGPLKASCVVTLGGKLEIHDVKVFEKDGSTWVQMPAKAIPNSKGGKPVYVALVKILDESLKREIETAVLATWAGGVE